MTPSFRQLQLFLALAERGSVTEAARVCGVTQPTASMQLKDLADTVGLPLFDVIGRRVHLTETGTKLADTARLMLGEWAGFTQEVDGMRGLTRGRLSVAVVSTAKYFMPRLLAGFCRKYPEIDIALEVLNRDGVVARLRDNRDDLAIMSKPPEDLETEEARFLSNPLVAIAPLTDANKYKKLISLNMLAEDRLILREKGSGTRLAIDALFAGAGLKPRIRLELGSNEAIKQSVAGGMGVGVVSRHALNADPASEGLFLPEVEGFPIETSWRIVFLKGKRLSPIARAFRDHLLIEARSL
ncbi:MAG: LysR family transcriptional regulator [Alphaproteobacteria bacterium]